MLDSSRVEFHREQAKRLREKAARTDSPDMRQRLEAMARHHELLVDRIQRIESQLGSIYEL
jgi:two-component sensor histidine kinase